MPDFDYDIFLSFSNRNEELARPLYEQFTAAGLRVFWSDETLKQKVGQSWYAEVGESLQSSRHLVLLWTEDAAQSKFVELEYSRFHSTTIRDETRLVVPVLPSGVSASSVPFMLGHLQCFSLEDDVDSLIRQLGGAPNGDQDTTVAVDVETTDANLWTPEITENGIEFVLIQPGAFTMGDDGISVASPAHDVTISNPFYLGKYPVTQAQWVAIMGNNPSRYKGEDNPVDQVSWDDVQSFLSKAESGYRLPTEAEWEYACRAGTTTAYSFGEHKEQLDTFAWYRKNAGNSHHPIGQKEPNPWGLYDMHGNIFEWVNDSYGTYEKEAVSDPAGPLTGKNRVIRGGSWSHFHKEHQSAFREVMHPGSKYSYIGFRLAKDID